MTIFSSRSVPARKPQVIEPLGSRTVFVEDPPVTRPTRLVAHSYSKFGGDGVDHLGPLLMDRYQTSS